MKVAEIYPNLLMTPTDGYFTIQPLIDTTNYEWVETTQNVELEYYVRFFFNRGSVAALDLTKVLVYHRSPCCCAGLLYYADSDNNAWWFGLVGKRYLLQPLTKSSTALTILKKAALRLYNRGNLELAISKLQQDSLNKPIIEYIVNECMKNKYWPRLKDFRR